jgi:uncharacterized membrane protein
MADISTSIFFYMVLFAIYSFMGWIIEVIYRSITQRKFVNAGFLFGPFVPIYGFGALFLILLQHYFQSWHFLPRLFIFGLALTILEYIVGYFAEKIFQLTLWDYSEHKFNLQGRVCLLFSAAWAILGFIFITFIHPAVLQYATLLTGAYLHTAAIALIIYYVVDFSFSVAALTEFREKIAYLYNEYLSLSNLEIEKIFDSFQRLRYAFPDLNRYINNKINNNIKKRIHSVLKSIINKIIVQIKDRKPFESEFYELINDIYEHEEFLKLKEYFHHNSSIYDHVQDVAYFSYRICKLLKLDYRSATRGALLHDFFLYDWRNHDVPDLPRKKYHGIAHPAIAVENAKKNFSINEIEEDIIKKHMWPLTIVPPKYKESFIVSFADKYLSSKEFISYFKSGRNQSLDES